MQIIKVLWVFTKHWNWTLTDDRGRIHFVAQQMHHLFFKPSDYVCYLGTNVVDAVWKSGSWRLFSRPHILMRCLLKGCDPNTASLKKKKRTEVSHIAPRPSSITTYLDNCRRSCCEASSTRGDTYKPKSNHPTAKVTFQEPAVNRNLGDLLTGGPKLPKNPESGNGFDWKVAVLALWAPFSQGLHFYLTRLTPKGGVNRNEDILENKWTSRNKFSPPVLLINVNESLVNEIVGVLEI